MLTQASMGLPHKKPASRTKRDQGQSLIIEFARPQAGRRDFSDPEMLRDRPDIVLFRDADRGVCDGFNQGLATATGDIVCFLNSNNVYVPGALAALGRTLSENPDADAVCGAAFLQADDPVLAVFDAEDDRMLAEPRKTFIRNCIINARFFGRSALGRIGTFARISPTFGPNR